MYILTDYRLILTKDTKDRPDLSSERGDPSGTALARPSSNSKLQTRPFVREDAPHQDTRNLSDKKQKSGHELQMGARHQDRLAVGCNITVTL
jgi:hypothetical protein